nr:MAG TPA: hypothetical protein [Caudoviricetes sp.]
MGVFSKNGISYHKRLRRSTPTPLTLTPFHPPIPTLPPPHPIFPLPLPNHSPSLPTPHHYSPTFPTHLQKSPHFMHNLAFITTTPSHHNHST